MTTEDISSAQEGVRSAPASQRNRPGTGRRRVCQTHLPGRPAPPECGCRPPCSRRSDVTAATGSGHTMGDGRGVRSHDKRGGKCSTLRVCTAKYGPGHGQSDADAQQCHYTNTQPVIRLKSLAYVRVHTPISACVLRSVIPPLPPNPIPTLPSSVR